MVKIPEKFKSSRKVLVNSTNIASQAGHPRVYYKINPKIGYVVCGYTNTCFVLTEDEQKINDNLFIYNGEG